ncbi:MAG: hypothetical protein R3E97_14635 [Candidatus Eisenbacteria bacterium]
MVVGVATKRLEWPEVFQRRLFPERLGLAEFERRYYVGSVPTPALGDRQRIHELRLAF